MPTKSLLLRLMVNIDICKRGHFYPLTLADSTPKKRGRKKGPPKKLLRLDLPLKTYKMLGQDDSS